MSKLELSETVMLRIQGAKQPTNARTAKINQIPRKINYGYLKH